LRHTHTNVRLKCADAGHAQEEWRAVADILARVGDKWTVMVVGDLSQRSMRYGEIFNLIEGISQHMLTLTLKGLERDGLVTRTLYPTIPPRVDYALTERGQTLIPPVVALWTWAQDHQAAIETSRRAFDQDRNRTGATSGVGTLRNADCMSYVRFQG
jgi:DNA-binding HxlR family transcriptional regulator